jgi:hypothetical protein
VSHTIVPANLEYLQHVMIGKTDLKKPKLRFRLSVDEARNSCIGKTSPVPDRRKTAFPRYKPMVGPSDSSALNCDKFMV